VINLLYKTKPRLMGGVFGIFAPPGNGKTYILTDIGLDMMKRGRRVFSNYPIRSLDGKYNSRVLTKEMLLTENFTDCVLLIQELHRWFNSRDFKEFTPEHHHFFSTSGHCQRSIYYDDQSVNRVDIVIREDTNLFYEIEKVMVPVLDYLGYEVPLYFRCFIYNDQEDMKMAHYGHMENVYDYDRVWFNINTAAAYDTRYFGHDDRPEFEGETWDDYYARSGITVEQAERTKIGELVNICKQRLVKERLLVSVKVIEPISIAVRHLKLRIAFKWMIIFVHWMVFLNHQELILVRAWTGLMKQKNDLIERIRPGFMAIWDYDIRIKPKLI